MTDNPGVPNVIRVLRAFEAALEQNDMSAADEMGRQWLAIEARLEPQVAALANEITQLRTSGQVVTEAMLLKQARYQSLLKQIDLEIKVFNRTSGVPIISNGQAIDAELGLKAAQEAIRAAYFDSGQVGGAFDVLHVDAVQKMVGFASDGSPLHSLLAKDYADAVDGVTKALIGGVARGLGPLAVAREMRDGMGMGLDRALLIARTEMLRSYRQASLDQYKAAGVVTKYMRRCANDERSCVECLAEDGMIMDTDALFDSHPDCRCFVIPILEGEPLPEMQTGEEWLAAQPEAYQKEILGPGRFELYQNGMPLIDMVDVVQDPDWGPTLELKTLGELREIGANMEKAADNAYDVIRFGQGAHKI